MVLFFISNLTYYLNLDFVYIQQLTIWVQFLLFIFEYVKDCCYVDQFELEFFCVLSIFGLISNEMNTIYPNMVREFKSR